MKARELYHPLRGVHNSMMSRCYNPKVHSFARYGAIGVTVCDEWKDYQTFKKWGLANGWEKGLQLDKDKLSVSKPGKIYSPEFCCFLTSKENNRNKRNNIYIEYKGETKMAVEWAEITGISYRLIISRMSKNLSPEKILTPKKHKQLVTINGITKSLIEWADYFEIDRNVVRSRYRYGYRGHYLFHKENLRNKTRKSDFNKTIEA